MCISSGSECGAGSEQAGRDTPQLVTLDLWDTHYSNVLRPQWANKDLWVGSWETHIFSSCMSVSRPKLTIINIKRRSLTSPLYLCFFWTTKIKKGLSSLTCWQKGNNNVSTVFTDHCGHFSGKQSLVSFRGRLTYIKPHFNYLIHFCSLSRTHPV